MNVLTKLIEEYIRKKQEDKGMIFCAASWLDSAAQRASQISVATHVLKFTNSEAKGTNVYYKQKTAFSRRYISTDSLSKIRTDTVGNAAAMDIAGILDLKVDGITFLELIAKNDSSALKPFTEDEQRLLSWIDGFKKILDTPKLSSHSLAKQIFFPVDENKYHLLSPLYASSLSHALLERVKEDKFGEHANVARECRRKEALSDLVITDYPNLAIQLFGGTKPQNISRLNSKRAGKSYLLRSTPPTWQNYKKAPLKKNAFWNVYIRNTYKIIDDFKKHIKDIKKFERQQFIDQLIERLLLEAAEIKSMPSGWSSASEISQHEMIWLDPDRQDLKDLRDRNEWQRSIANDFATVIIRKLKYKDESFSAVEHQHLSDECYTVLKEFE